MLAVAESGQSYFYLNWVPSENGPLVSNFGKIDKNDKIENIDEFYYDIFFDLLKYKVEEESICTFSLDSKNILFSTCSMDEINDSIIDWHIDQCLDKNQRTMIDFYHYPMHKQTKKVLNIGIPKVIRDSFHLNMRLLKSRLNGLSVGIFSAEVGARKWMFADKNQSYIIWKTGKNKNDEILYINDGELHNYFGFNRKLNQARILWNFGCYKTANKIVTEINKIYEIKRIKSAEHVYLYTSNGSINEVKKIHNLKINNLTLLNPLEVLNKSSDKKYNKYSTLALAETGNAFRGIDV